jgi:hypothetical protein
MRFRTKLAFLLIAGAVVAIVSHVDVQAAMDVLWLDFDMKNIPEPKERTANFYDNFFHEQIFEEGKQDLDVPRWIRTITGHPKPAMDVNAVDEIPDSSWFTNRHNLRHMSIEDVIRGPNQGNAPDFNGATITKAKSAGITPGLQLKDKKGDAYLIKFDHKEYPELQSAAEVISTKILYAAGYNVPENYIAYIRPEQLAIADDLKLTREDLAKMLEPVAKLADGRYRILASKFIPGKPKGPFPHIGIRHDDPNDLIPHEHRRELRGLRVIASWINHWDMKEQQGFDTYVEEHGRKFLRHYLLDFGSTLGAGQFPTEYFRGRENVLDVGNIMKELISLGLYFSPDEKKGTIVSKQVGMFTSQDFDAKTWTTTYPVMAFQNMTDEDAFWAMRTILSFSEAELRKIVETGEYTDPKDTAYVLQTLLERRSIVAQYWLPRVNPIARFSVEPHPEGIAVKFHDFMVESNLAFKGRTAYEYEVKGNHHTSRKQTTQEPVILLDRKTLDDTPIEVTIRTRRAGTDDKPVTIYLLPKSNGQFAVGRISRG